MSLLTILQIIGILHLVIWPAALIASVMSLSGFTNQSPIDLRSFGFILFHIFIIIYPAFIFLLVKLENKLYANQKIGLSYALALIPVLITCTGIVYKYLDNEKSKLKNATYQESKYQRAMAKSALLAKLMKPFIFKEEIPEGWIENSLEGVTREELNENRILFHVLVRARIGYLGESTDLNLAKKNSLVEKHAHILKRLAIGIINRGGKLDYSRLEKRFDIRFAEHILKSTMTTNPENLTKQDNPLVWQIVQSICLKKVVPKIKDLMPFISSTSLNKESTIYGTPLSSLFILKDTLRNQSSTFLIRNLIQKGAFIKADQNIQNDLLKKFSLFVKKGHLQ